MTSYADMMLMLYHFPLKRDINSLLMSECYSRQYDRSGQCDHVDGGCLREWNKVVDAYLDRVIATLDAPHLAHSFHRILDILDWSQRSPRDIDESAEWILLHNPAKVVAHVLKGPNNTPADYFEASQAITRDFNTPLQDISDILIHHYETLIRHYE